MLIGFQDLVNELGLFLELTYRIIDHICFRKHVKLKRSRIFILLPLPTFAKNFQLPGNWPKSSFECTGRRVFPRFRVVSGAFRKVLQEITDIQVHNCRII